MLTRLRIVDAMQLSIAGHSCNLRRRVLWRESHRTGNVLAETVKDLR